MDTFVRKTDELIDLYVNGEVISTTGEHPFWVPDKGWVEAKDLQVGSLLQTEDGKIIDIDEVEKRSGEFEVYNFKVDGFHTYFVSDLEVLVHNADYADGDFDIPELQLSKDDFSIKSSVTGDPKAFIRAELPKPGVIEITDIFRGSTKRQRRLFFSRNTKGSGGFIV